MITSFKISNMILHIVFISIFIIVLFFTYGTILEKKIVKLQIEYVVDKMLRNIKTIYPQLDMQQLIGTKIISIEDNVETKKAIDKKNRNLMIKSGISMGVLILIGISLILFIGWKFERKLDNGTILSYKTYLSKLTAYNLLTLLCVGLTYFGFINFVGYNYIYIDYYHIFKQTINKVISMRDLPNK